MFPVFKALSTSCLYDMSSVQFYIDTKQDLKEGKVLVVCDFAENYSFVVQDEIQSFHWNSEITTVHPLVAY